MGKQTKRDNPNKSFPNGGDSHYLANSTTPRTMRSNAAVSQMFIASTTSSTNTSLTRPITVPTLPYSSGQAPMRPDVAVANLDSLHRKSNLMKSPLMSGASLLRQDFFSRGVEEAHHQHDNSPKTEVNEQISDDRPRNSKPSLDDNHNREMQLIDFSEKSTPSENVASIPAEIVSSEHIMPNDENLIMNTTRIQNGDAVMKPTCDLVRNSRSLLNSDESKATRKDISPSYDITPEQMKLSDHASSSIASCSLSAQKDENQTPTNCPIVDVMLDMRSSSQSRPEAAAHNNLDSSASTDPTPGPSNTSLISESSNKSAPESTSSRMSRLANHDTSNASIDRPMPAERRHKSSRRLERKANLQGQRFATISKLPSISSSLHAQQLQEINVDLPSNWEARLDAHGRIFYIDHERRTTTWHRPPTTVNLGTSVMRIKVPQSRITEIEVGGKSLNSDSFVEVIDNTASPTDTARVEDSTEQQRALLNRRYTLRRTISARHASKGHDDSLGIDQDAELTDPTSVKIVASVKSSPTTASDALDGNCMSSSSTNRARSYNLCMDDSLRQLSLNDQSRQAPHQQESIQPVDSCSIQPIAGPSQASTHLGEIQGPSQTGNGISPTKAHQLSPSISSPSALKFLNRSDFFNLLHLNDEALSLYNTSSNLKFIINRVRKDRTNSAYERYQHNKDLVAFLNKFAMKHKSLPTGWDIRFDEHGKSFFIDHMRKATTYVDPRLPTEMPLVNPCRIPMHDHRTPASVVAAASNLGSLPEDETQQASSSRYQQAINDRLSRDQVTEVDDGSTISQNPAGSIQTHIVEPVAGSSSQGSDSTIVNYEEKIVVFFKQSNIFGILQSKRSASCLLNSSLREKINQIRKGGVNVLKKYSHDVNLMMLISLFDSEIDAMTSSSSARSSMSPQVRSSVGRIIVPGKRDFEEKLRYFYRKLEQKSFGQGPNKLKLGVRRDHILEDAFSKVMSIHSKKDLQRSRLYVSFAGEEGLDYGGPSREFFFLLSRELFNPYYGKFLQNLSHLKLRDAIISVDKP